ncbi:MAG: Asp23/Gls24 family envelope stress response protein [Lachnospiraceae bacterium]|nr:Asp23/Gls24 family envelope stress response protein [Lachnospiraceae bacterium]
MADKNTFEIKEGVSISDEVVAIVAGLAATEVDGVEALTGNITNAAIPKTGASKLSKGVRISANPDGSISAKLSLMIRYGFEIPTICARVQEKVKNAIENMTGIGVQDVDIRIANVVM